MKYCCVKLHKKSGLQDNISRDMSARMSDTYSSISGFPAINSDSVGASLIFNLLKIGIHLKKDLQK